MDSLTLRRPDDFHLHLRDDAVMAAVLPDSVRCFARAIIMPNLKPPVAAVALAAAYRQRILAAIPAGMQFTPLMTLYLTDRLAVDEIDRAVDSGFVHAVKLYPAGATTNADSGVTDLRNVRAVLERMQLRQLPLLIHCEVADPAVDVFDREAVFIERVLTPLLADFPQLRVVFEHLTTRDGVDFVRAGGDNLAGTITAHHLLLNRNAIFSGGIRPHHYCLPVLKRETHRQALLAAAVSGSSKFFLGSDSAPHPRKAKEAACGCAGCYTAHAAIELYAEAFDSVGALDRLEYFASGAGADFYRLPRNSGAITLERSQWRPPALLPLPPDDELVPFRGGETIAWRLAPATPT